MQPRVLLAGVARRALAPPLGVRMWGYTVQEDLASGFESELSATVLVLGDGQTSVAIAGIDVLFIPMPHAEAIRAAIGERIGIPAENVILNGSHTHLGPMLPGWQAESSPQKELQEQALADVTRAIVEAAAESWAHRQPARIAHASGSAPIGVNRRERIDTGEVIVGENWDGPIDRAVDVLRIDDLAGKPLAIVVSAACHPVVLGPKTANFSPDFVGPAREAIEAQAGCLSIFLQGAAGNINPVSGIGGGGPVQFDEQRRLGTMLAGESLKVWAGLRTERLRTGRRIVRSVAALSVFDYEPAPEATVQTLAVGCRRLKLPLAPFPEIGELAKAEAKAREAKTIADTGDSLGAKNVAWRKWQYADQRLRMASAGVAIPELELDIWAWRLNDLSLVAFSAEILSELGLEIKARSPSKQTLVLGCTNGCFGYIPPPHAFAEGGMEVVESHVNYLLPSQLTPEWAPKVVDKAIDLLNSLQG